MTTTHTTRSRRRATWAAALSLTAIVVAAAGCGGDESGDDAATTGAAAAAGVPFDRAFIDAMVPHHQGAIEMARAAKAAGLSEPELVDIANAIETTQQDEIDRMLEWREQWFGSGEIDPNGADALGLSEEQMGMQHEGVDFSSSDDVNADFASMMIDHHNGAIAMARLAQDRGQHSAVRELADVIIEAQEREVEVMEEHAGDAMHHD